MNKNNKPLNKEELVEQYEELKLKLAVIEYAERIGEELMEEGERFQDNPLYQPNPEGKSKFIKEMEKNYKVIQREKNLQKILQKSRKAALAVSIVLLLLVTTYHTVEAVRINVRNLFINTQDEYTEIKLKDQEPQEIEAEPEINWEGAYIPSIIPKGFKIAKVTNLTNNKTIEYRNIAGDTIFFQQRNENSGMNIDTEEAEVEKVIIQGVEGLLANKHGLTTLAWHNKDCFFRLSIYAEKIDKALALEIAESVKLIEN